MNIKELKDSIAGLLKIDTAKAQLTDAVANIEALTTANADLVAQIEDYKKTIAAFPIAKQEWEAEMTKVKSEHTAAIEALNQQLKETQTSVNKEASKIMESVGVQPDTVKPIISQELTPSDVLAKLATLNGTEKTEYYNKHRDTILRTLKLVQ